MRGRYDKKLFERAAEGPMNATEIGEIVGTFGPDAVCRLRLRKDLVVTIVGTTLSEHGGPPRKLYRVERKVDHVEERWYGGTD